MENNARLDLLRIASEHCWLCGKQFNKNETEHHAIPQFLKPKRNAIIPICQQCHREINKFLIQTQPKFKAIKNYISDLENIIKKNKKILERYINEE